MRGCDTPCFRLHDRQVSPANIGTPSERARGQANYETAYVGMVGCIAPVQPHRIPVR